MEVKKNPKANLESYSKLFLQLGLVLALLIIYVGIEYKTFDKSLADLGDANNQEEVEEDIPITERIEQIKPPPPPPPAPEKIEVVEDEKEIEETVLESTETDENDAVEIEDIEEAVEDEFVDEDVPFAIIEDVPVYPGCKGTKAQKKACLNKSMQKHVARKFNADLATDLGLSPGKKKIYIQFKITKTGTIQIIGARAPHARLEKEAKRVVSLLPKMTPGKQRGRPVNVTYMLPISFNVE
jgi:protein TonB